MAYLQSFPKTALLASTHCDQAQLLSALAQGDRSAFWSLWQINRQYLYSQCLKWMDHRCHDADEALSRAMVKAWDKLPHYAHRIHNLRGWLSRLTYHICMDFYRENDRISYSLDESTRGSLCFYEKLASKEHSPDDTLQRHELRGIIQAAIASLPERLREPCRLRFCENWSYPQLATHFHMSEPTARKRIQQARAILRRRISGYLGGHFSTHIETLAPFEELNAA